MTGWVAADVTGPDTDEFHTDRNGHRHENANCFECIDCQHPQCWHLNDPTAVEAAGQCDWPWCNCLEAVAVDGERNRCARCGGYGEIAVEPIPLDPQLLQLRQCPVCDGSGDVQKEAEAS